MSENGKVMHIANFQFQILPETDPLCFSLCVLVGIDQGKSSLLVIKNQIKDEVVSNISLGIVGLFGLCA